VLFVRLLLHLFVSQQDYYKSSQPISLKFGIMIAPSNWKNRSTFGGDTILNTDSGSLFHFPQHFRIGHFIY